MCAFFVGVHMKIHYKRPFQTAKLYMINFYWTILYGPFFSKSVCK